VLHVPDTAGRYYVMECIDAWSNNFAYPGRRATGTAEGEFLLAPRGYGGEVPDGIRVIHAPTNVFVIAGRLQVDGDGDLPTVRALQDQFTLTPLSVHSGGAAPGPLAGLPQPDERVPTELEWWERFRVALAAFPPPKADAPFLAGCAKLGLTAPDSPYIDLDPERAQVLIEGAKAGEAMIEQLMKQVHASPAGWQSAMHLFDYNLDFFELGAIDAPQWKIPDRTQAYVTRAVVARAGLWGNHGYEANYEIIWVDADGQPLHGAGSYELRLDPAPPVDAFWSLTMYDAEGFQVANPLNRFAIGDRDALKYNADGSLDLTIQHDDPGAEKQANWLPSPAGGPLGLTLRLYAPKPEALDGRWAPPPVRKQM
jgi:hypothetical protein